MAWEKMTQSPAVTKLMHRFQKPWTNTIITDANNEKDAESIIEEEHHSAQATAGTGNPIGSVLTLSTTTNGSAVQGGRATRGTNEDLCMSFVCLDKKVSKKL